MADGKITIDIEANSDKFDRQIMDLEKKIEKEEKNKIIIKTDIKRQEADFEDAIKETDKYAEALQRVQKLKEIVASQKATPKQFTELQNLTREYGTEEQITKNFDKALDKQIKIEQQLEKTKRQYSEINVKVDEYNQKVEGLRLQKHQKDVQEVRKSFDKVGNSIQHSIKNISRLALSIIGIRSLLLGVRQAVSMLSQYDEGLANRIQAIKLALASALAPLVEFIVNLLSKAVSLLGFVLKTLFGVDIFAKASAMSLKSATGSAKELRKQLAGFDEMNVLNADGTTNLGGVGGLAQTLQDMNKEGEGIFKGIRKWLLGSDKDTFQGILEDNIEYAKEQYQILKNTFAPLDEWIKNNVWEPMKESFGQVIDALEPLIKPFRDAWNDLLENHLKPMWTDFVNFMKPNVIDPIIDYFRPLGLEIYNFIVPYINALIDWINEVFGFLGIHLDHWEYKTEEAMENTDEKAEKTGDNIEKNLGLALADATKKASELDNQDIDIDVSTTEIDNAENGLQNILDKLWELVSQPWSIVTKIVAKGSNSLNNFLQPLRNTLSSIGINLPFLATGGIVNMPNRGTYIGGAIAGESGREGVIPLTDQQAMAELGREIGKNVLVNLTNITSMNGRIISRELKQVQNEQDFAYNT